MNHSDIPGWFYAKGVYDYAAEQFDYGSFVEVGAWLGKSTAYLAGVIDSCIRLHVVDTWKGSKDKKSSEVQASILEKNGGDLFLPFMDNMEKCGVLKSIIPLRMSSVQAARLFPLNSVSFCFLDGDHEESSVLQDLNTWYPKIREGGIIAGDDYGVDWPGVDVAVNSFFRGQNRERIQIMGRSWLVRKER